MNGLFSGRRKLIIIGVAVLLIVAAVLVRSSDNIKIVKSSVKNGVVGQFDTLSLSIDKDLSAYASDQSAIFSITPLVRGNLIIKGKDITFAPLGGFAAETNYTVKVFNAAAKSKPFAVLKFKTTKDLAAGKSSFINSLPYSGDGFNIDYNQSFGTFNVEITSVPVDQYKKAAFTYLNSQGFSVTEQEINYIVPAVFQPDPNDTGGGD